MPVMLSKTYDALISAGAPDGTKPETAASEELASHYEPTGWRSIA